MKKLYVNIQTVKILKGGANMLTTAVTDIDRAVESLANETISMYRVLMRYAATEQGAEYKKATDEVGGLVKKLSAISTELNGFQHDIVRLQEKIKKYERDRSPNASPRKLCVQPTNVAVNTSVIEFHAEEMKSVVSSMENYLQSIEKIMRELKAKKDALSGVWQDPQYRTVFSPYIDDIKNVVQKSVLALREYKEDLRVRIKELEAN